MALTAKEMNLMMKSLSGTARDIAEMILTSQDKLSEEQHAKREAILKMVQGGKLGIGGKRTTPGQDLEMGQSGELLPGVEYLEGPAAGEDSPYYQGVKLDPEGNPVFTEPAEGGGYKIPKGAMGAARQQQVAERMEKKNAFYRQKYGTSLWKETYRELKKEYEDYEMGSPIKEILEDESMFSAFWEEFEARLKLKKKGSGRPGKTKKAPAPQKQRQRQPLKDPMGILN